jgi:CBS domain-containing protein
MTKLSQLLDIKGHHVEAIDPEASVLDAIRQMAENHIGALLVMQQGKLIGVLSERDYARKVVLMGRSSTSTAVREIMSSPAITIDPHSSVDDAMRLMTEKRIRHLPVVQGGAVTGLLSIGDLVKWVVRDQQHTIEELRSYIHG